MLVDSHCHLDMLDLASFDGGLDGVIAAAQESGVGHMLCVSVSLEDYPAMLALVEDRDEVSVVEAIGELAGKRAIMLDDMIDTAGTLCQAAAALKAHGAGDVYATATHAVLSGPALERINESSLKEVLITDTIPTEEKVQKCSRLRTVSVANLLAESIRRIHGDESVSSLFI